MAGPEAAGKILNDTWLQVSGELEWNTPIFAPTVHEFPPGLSHTALAYDPQDDQLILFGGDLASGSAYGGTWGFAGDSWVNFTWTNFTSPTGPGPVATPAMAYNPTVNGDPALHGVERLFDVDIPERYLVLGDRGLWSSRSVRWGHRLRSL